MAASCLLLALSLLPSPAQAGSVTFADVEAMLADETRAIRSVDDFLAQPEFARGFLRHFTLMYQSRSMQGAGPLHPRVIAYGEDAKLVLTFTCAPGDCGGTDARGAGTVELVHWKEGERSFEFREIEFPEGKSVTRPTLSSPNPRKCMGCHLGPDPRPNWETYSLWPGAYGGDDDHLAGSLAPGEDRALLQQFLAGAGERPRYQRLLELAEGYQVGIARDKREHNIDLTLFLNRLNMRRIADRMLRSPHYERMKPAISETLQSSRTMLAQLTFAGLRPLAEMAGPCLQPSLFPRPPERHQSHLSHVARLFHAFGEATIPWFMSFRPTLRNEIVTAEITDQVFFSELYARDQTLKDYTSRQVDAAWQSLAREPWLESALEKCAKAH